MAVAAAELVLAVLAAYAVVGAAVAAVFLAVGVGRAVPEAAGAYAFRPLLIPGAVLLWPLVVLRWAAAERLRRRA
jgi:hypothetical protein